ncbi:MAG: class I SAM-dependent methyltransferase [Proteobacteria bacterium]|nr:class I SAM-dependent methyltransferase [Pseudomonadota bacterium]
MLDRTQKTQREGAGPSSFNELFERYSANTDGKERIAEYVNTLGKEIVRPLLVDLGAGDGRLTRRLLQGFDEIIAIEKQPAFIPNLAVLPGVTAIASSIEDFIPTRPYDVGLLSYSLSGVPKARLQETLERLLAGRNKGGRLLFVTYADGCDWDRFTEEASYCLNLPRTGGLARHRQELSELGFTSRVVTTINTSIWGQSSTDLFNNLAFFFYKRINEYLVNAAQLQPILEKFQFWDVQEAIVEIQPKS